MRKFFAVAAVGVAAVLALAGCGGSTGGAPTAIAPPAPTTYQNIDDLGNALINATKQNKSAKFTMDITSGQQKITGNGSYMLADSGSPAVQMTMAIPSSGNIDMIFADGKLYIKGVPGAPGAKPWAQVPIDPSNPATAQLANFGDQVDPSKQFEQFKKAGTLKGSTPDTLDGVATTKYSLSVDPTKVGDGSAQMPAGTGPIPVDLWLDGKDLPVQLQTNTSAQGQTVSVTVKYADWGLPTTITAPPADQVSQLPG